MSKCRMLFLMTLCFLLFENAAFSQSKTSKEEPSAQYEKNEKRTVKGLVLGEDGKPIPGVTIIGKGTSFGTITLPDGRFVFDVPAQVEELIIKFVGLETQEIEIGNKREFKIVLKSDVKVLDDVVAIGYQTVSKRDVVGAYTQIDAKDIENVAYSNIDQMLQGQVAGMMVTNTAVQVTAKPKITIRGTSTILGNQDPLWVVDGIIQPDFVDLDLSSELGDLTDIIGNQVSWLNPSDIESITVLKDASATAVYGSKASNGVIVVETKKGVEGKLNVNYSSSFSMRAAPNYGMFNMMNSKERINASIEAYNEGMLYNYVPLKQDYTYEGLMRQYLDNEVTLDYFQEQLAFLETVNTDWFDALTQNSLSQTHNLSFSGGSSSVMYRASLSYTNNKGVEIGDQAQRYTATMRIDANPYKKLRVSLNMSASNNKNDGFGQGVSPYTYTLTTSRAIPLYDQNGDDVYYKERSYYNYNSDARENGLGFNILNERENSYRLTNESRLSASANIIWSISDMFRYELVGGYTQNNKRTEVYSGQETFYIADQYRGYLYGDYLQGSPEYQAAILPHGGVLQPSTGEQTSFNIQNKLVFKYTLKDDHRFNAMLAHEIRSATSFDEGNMLWGYLPDRGQILISPTKPSSLVPIGSSSTSYEGYGILADIYNKRWKRNEQTDNYLSIFGTFAYTYKNKYTLNATVRSDESNRFGTDTNNRFKPTWSAGLAWSMDQEEFMQDIHWLNQAKWRFSYGLQGNALTNKSPELITTQGQYNSVYGQYVSVISQLPNPNLTWEKTKNWNVGLDLMVFNKFTTSIEYYGRRSVVVAQQEVPQYNGLDVLAVNGAEVTNHGFEYTVSFNPIKTKDFYWNIRLNAGKNFNTARFSYTPENLQINAYLTGSSEYVLREGYDLSSFWSYSFAGLDSSTGYPTFNKMSVQLDSEGYPTLGTITGIDSNGNPITEWQRVKDTNGNVIKDYTVDSSGRITLTDIETTEQLVYSGKRTPDFSGGLSSSFRYKDLTLGIHFSAQFGKKIRLSNPYSSMQTGKMPDPLVNLDKELDSRWRKSGDELTTTIPALPSNGMSYMQLPSGDTGMLQYNMWAYSDVRVVSGNFVRCNNLSLTYNVPQSLIGGHKIKSMSFSGAVSNLFVIASKELQGFDPELATRTVQPQVYSFSLNVGF